MCITDWKGSDTTWELRMSLTMNIAFHKSVPFALLNNIYIDSNINLS